jgi:hypothetical protein
MGKKYQRMDGESLATFNQRCQQAENSLRGGRKKPRGGKKRRARFGKTTQQQRNADHIDGHDRDDLGESPDF